MLEKLTDFIKNDLWDWVKRNSITTGILAYLMLSVSFSDGLINIIMYITSLLCYAVIATQLVLFTLTKTNFLEHSEDSLSTFAKILVIGIVFLSVSLLIALGSWIQFSDILK